MKQLIGGEDHPAGEDAAQVHWNILLIDDDEDDYLITRWMLSEIRGAQCDLEWAPTLASGREALQMRNYDAALVDYDLGVGKGLDLIREAVSRGYHSPIILLTGHGSYEVDVEAMQAGATLYLTKEEVNPLLLERTIRYAIEYKRVNQELQKAREGLELKVLQRTAEIAQVNRELRAEIATRKTTGKIIRLQSTALEAAADGILITNLEGVIQWCNPALSAMTGFPATEMIGRTPAIFNSGRHPPEYYAALWSTVLSGNIWRGETYNRRRDGSIYVEEQTITPVMDEKGNISNFIAIKHDITDRKEAEEKITRRNWELQALNTISSAVSTSLDLSHTFELVKQLLSRELSIPSGEIFSYDPGIDRFQLEASWGAVDSRPVLSELPIAAHQRAVREKKPVRGSWQALEDRSPTVEGGDPAPQSLDYLCIPLLSQGEVQGVLDLSLAGSKIFSEEQLDFFESMGNQVGVLIHNVKLFRAEKQAHRLAETLRSASLALSRSLDLDVVIRTMLDSIENLVPEADGIILFTLEGKSFLVKAVGGKKIGSACSLPDRLELEDFPLLNEIVETGTARLVEYPLKHPHWRGILKNLNPQSWLGVPIFVAGNLIGLCSLVSETERGFTRQHIQLTEALLAGAAISIQNARLYQEVREGHEQHQALSRRLVEIQELERRYIARELHDETSQSLIGLVFALDILKREAGSPQAVAAGVDQLDRLIREILNKLHQLAVDLRPTALDHLGLIPAIRQYVDGIQEKYSLAISLNVSELPTRLPPDMETNIFRIVQEALANVVRHARASRVEVCIELEKEQVQVSIIDNGAGFDVDEALTNGRLGLFGMRERAEMLGGNLFIHSAPGRGTRISLEAPCVITNLDN